MAEITSNRAMPSAVVSSHLATDGSALLKTTLRDADGNELSLGGVTQLDDGSIAASQTPQFGVNLLYLYDDAAGVWKRFSSQNLDYDTGGTSAAMMMVGIALPGAGGPVAGGTSTNPLYVSTGAAVAVSSAVTSVNDTAASTQLLASLATRKGYKLFNDSTVTAYVKEGTTATMSDYSYKILAGGFYESVGTGCYTGRIDCIWASDAAGAMKITELT